jgi:transcriptional regulator with PAS, ATPase and Fis domain
VSREGAVFLDEIGEIEPAIQVKLLRVLETRIFQPIGEFRNHRFTGKVIAATNRNLEKEMEAGRFRQDLYYRLCSDIITTPSLREQLEGASGPLQHNLVLFLARRVAGAEGGGVPGTGSGRLDSAQHPGGLHLAGQRP